MTNQNLAPEVAPSQNANARENRDSSENNSAKTWAIRFALIGSAVFWLALVASSWAEAADSQKDEYSFKWLDPEKKIYVLQNRKYLKANRPMLSVLGGPGLSNPYRTSYTVEPRISFYLSEQWGLEVTYGKTFNSENNTYQALKQASGTGVLPVVREINSQYGASVHWVPWYAKINVFNQILYFDWYFSGGAGTVQTTAFTSSGTTTSQQSQDFFALFAGTGHQYFLSDSLTFRLDFSGAFYQAPVFGNSGDKTWFSNFNFAIGLGFRI